MEPYLVSLGAGLLVGVIYSAIKVRSPAPPLVALIGLLGMVIGVQAIPALKQLFGL
jgi:XapX domain-containing protein